MLLYCLKWKKKNTKSTNPRDTKTSNFKTMSSSKCTIWGSKKARSVKNQKASGLLSISGIKTPLSKTTLLNNILF